MQLWWTFEHLVGYLGTWSPRKPFLAERGKDALGIAFPRLREAWGAHGQRPGLVAPLRARVQGVTSERNPARTLARSSGSRLGAATVSVKMAFPRT